MKIRFAFPWQRIALIGFLAEQKQGSGLFGRTALMKFMYFLQEAEKVDLGYDFTLYNYGPFDPQVLSDLDTAQLVDAVSVTVQHFGGYRIDPAGRLDEAKKRAGDFLEEYATSIDKIVSDFAELNAKELELRATAHHVYGELVREGEGVSHEALMTRVKTVKPEFSSEAVSQAIADLVEKGYLEL